MMLKSCEQEANLCHQEDKHADHYTTTYWDITMNKPMIMTTQKYHTEVSSNSKLELMLKNPLMSIRGEYDDDTSFGHLMGTPPNIILPIWLFALSKQV